MRYCTLLLNFTYFQFIYAQTAGKSCEQVVKTILKPTLKKQ